MKVNSNEQYSKIREVIFLVKIWKPLNNKIIFPAQHFKLKIKLQIFILVILILILNQTTPKLPAYSKSCCYLFSSGSLVGHPAGHPDAVWSDGLHRLPLQH